MRKNLVIVVISVLFLTGCIDKNTVKNEPPATKIQKTTEVIYPEPINITINGTDYQQAQTPIGKFGGDIVVSTIGDGPKTFNPWESKDATSSAVGDLLYDGLTTTDVNTGKTIPKLAKTIDILPDKKTYIVHLRKA